MKSLKSKILSVLSILTIFSTTVLPVQANSLPDIWYGEKGNMLVPMDGDCPIEVESEVLTFDIQEFFKEEYESGEDFLAYDGKVTAEYTFYNPTESKITATLAFPFGNYPTAAEDPETFEYTDDTEKYAITINGKEIEKKLRYTFSGFMEFEPFADKEKLRNEYVNDIFYKPDMPVTKYTYDIMKNDVAWENLDVMSNVVFDSDKTKLYAHGGQYVWLNEDGSYDMEVYAPYLFEDMSERKTVSIYVIGEELENEIVWKFYDMEEEKDVEGEVVFVEKEKLTLEELAFVGFDKEKGISETDWYNAFVYFLKDGELEKGSTGWGEFGFGMDLSQLLMRWYEYEITIDPGETIVNTVTAPIYPTIDKEYNPARYEYMYLLSPAKLWSDFGTLEIVINTPYHLVSENKAQFEKTDNGYVLMREGLPDDELTFTLSETPVSVPNSPLFYVLCLILLAIIIVVVVSKVKSRKEENV